MPIIRDPNTGALTYDPSMFAVPNLPSRMNQSYAMPSSSGWGSVGQGQGVNPLMLQMMNAYAQRQGQQAQDQQIASAANAWGNAQGITPQNQWDARWKLMNDNSPLGVWGRASLRQDYGGQPVPTSGPNLGGASPEDPAKRKAIPQNFTSGAAGGSDLVYSRSALAPWEQGQTMMSTATAPSTPQGFDFYGGASQYPYDYQW